MPLTLAAQTLLQSETAIATYFQTFNQGEFAATAQLFAAQGQLVPPFEEPIVGVEAIRTYLEREADGMQAQPKSLEIETLENDRRRIVVRGSVKAIVFNVNAAWIFDLTPQAEIERVEVKLLASLQDLLTLRS